MALDIAPTPTLGRRASRKFLKKVKKDLEKPVGLVPTPKLAEAKRLILNAREGQK